MSLLHQCTSGCGGGSNVKDNRAVVRCAVYFTPNPVHPDPATIRSLRTTTRPVQYKPTSVLHVLQQPLTHVKAAILCFRARIESKQKVVVMAVLRVKILSNINELARRARVSLNSWQTPVSRITVAGLFQFVFARRNAKVYGHHKWSRTFGRRRGRADKAVQDPHTSNNGHGVVFVYFYATG